MAMAIVPRSSTALGMAASMMARASARVIVGTNSGAGGACAATLAGVSGPACAGLGAAAPPRAVTNTSPSANSVVWLSVMSAQVRLLMCPSLLARASVVLAACGQARGEPPHRLWLPRRENDLAHITLQG